MVTRRCVTMCLERRLARHCNSPRRATPQRLTQYVRLHILVDRTSIEVFAGGGRVYMPVGVVHPEDNKTLETTTTGGAAKVVRLEVYELKSTWE